MDTSRLQSIRAGKKVFHLYTMKNGVSICCHGKPKKTDLVQMHKEFGINYVLTILYPKEKPESIQKFCSEISPDIQWDNLQLFGAGISYLMQKNTIKLIIDHILSLIEYFKTHQNTRIYLHCAAGLHRTGTVLYTILRCCGESEETVMDVIKSIRYETFRDMGQKRIDYAEKSLVAPILEFLAKKNDDEESNMQNEEVKIDEDKPQKENKNLNEKEKQNEEEINENKSQKESNELSEKEKQNEEVKIDEDKMQEDNKESNEKEKQIK